MNRAYRGRPSEPVTCGYIHIFCEFYPAVFHIFCVIGGYAASVEFGEALTNDVRNGLWQEEAFGDTGV